MKINGRNYEGGGGGGGSQINPNSDVDSNNNK